MTEYCDLNEAMSRLKTGEILLRVDFIKPRNQIMAELAAAVDVAQRKLNVPSSERWRQEVTRHLRVWRLRKEKKPFSQIAKEMNMSEDTAKDSFYRGYELTQRRAYDRQAFLREAWTQKLENLERICATCPDRKNCTTLCPQIMAYVDQDQIFLREKILREDTEDLKDHLFETFQ